MPLVLNLLITIVFNAVSHQILKTLQLLNPINLKKKNLKKSQSFETCSLIYKSLSARKCCGNREEMGVRIFHRQRCDL